jgi:glycosyltransferase involved in cell wall biosynthesis
MLKISAVMITCNAGRTIGRALESVRAVCAEAIVVDSGSTDSTVSICRELGAKVIQKQWEGYSRQKNFAVEQAACPWILSLDADEELTAELAQEIRGLDDDTAYDGFRMPRRNYYFGRALRFGGQFPDLQLRLFRKGSGRFNDRPLHESVEVKGAVGRLRGVLEHDSDPTLEDYFEKFGRYTELEAQRLLTEGHRPTGIGLVVGLVVAPFWKFVRRYFFKLGFLDGVPGLLAAALGSFTMIVSRAKCWEARRAASRAGGNAGGPPVSDRTT